MKKSFKIKSLASMLILVSAFTYSATESIIGDGLDLNEGSKKTIVKPSKKKDSLTVFNEAADYDSLRSQFSSNEDFLKYIQQNELYEIIDSRSERME